MKRIVRDMAASKRERLANHARSHGDAFDLVVRRFFFERFLYRLSISPVRDRFILKGAMLFQVWADQPYRATADLDLLRKASRDSGTLAEEFRLILTQTVDPHDGIAFDAGSTRFEAIRAEDEYAGTRVRFMARLGAIRDRLQVDVGTSDSVWPAPKRITYPVLLDDVPPRVLAYSRDSVIAEKLEAIVTLGIRNSRIKDFFDLHYLASHFNFDGATLHEAVRRTFKRRKTTVPTEPPTALSTEFWNDPARAAHLRAFARRARIGMERVRPADILPLLVHFLIPLLDAVAHDRVFERRWIAGGPWRE